MKTIIRRLFQTGSDLDSITSLWLACCAANNTQASCSPTDLHEALAQEVIRANTRHWFEAGNRLLAYAYVDPYRNLKFDIAPVALKARLSTSNQNIAMQKTAASAGFFTYSRSLWFSKALPETD